MAIATQNRRLLAFRKRRRPDSNRGMEVLQTSALPLGYGAESASVTELSS